MIDKELAATFDRRSALFITGGVILTSLLVLRMLQLQVFENKKYKRLSGNNSSRIIIQPAARGKILAADGSILARDEAVYRAFIIPNECEDISAVIDVSAKILNLSKKSIERIQKRIETQSKFQPVLLKENVKWEQLAALKSLSLAGLHLESGFARKYPGPALAAHTVGYVGTIDDSRTNPQVAATSPFLVRGIAGLEKVFDDSLSGRPGKIITNIDAIGRMLDDSAEARLVPIPGKNLSTTIRENVQKKMEDALAANAAGCGVALDIDTGAILAMASAPSFDANRFRADDGADYMDELRKNKLKPFMNKAIEGLYPPGSTFKIVVAMAALESGAISQSEKILCTGSWEYGDHLYHCWEKHGHGWVNLTDALQHSCDIYFYQLALRIGINPIKSMAEKLGFGQKLLNLLPFEAAGIIPDREWKQKNVHQSWMHGDTIISGIGQGYILANCLQLAVMGARAASNRAVIPYITAGGEPAAAGDIGLNPDNIKILLNGLAKVTKEGGTAAGTQWIVKNMGGKTGTSQVRRISMQERETGVLTNEQLQWEQRNHGLFVGLAPIDNPKYSVAIITEHSGGSGQAARAAAEVIKELLANSV